MVGSPSRRRPMSRLDFKSNSSIGIGVEIEIQLVDQTTGDLKPVAPKVLQAADALTSESHLKSELFQSMLEIDTPVCSNAREAGASLRSSLTIARNLANQHDAEVIMAGTHPFAHYSDRLLTPSGRYFSLVDRNQWIARRLQIFGLHVHLGMRDGDHAIAMNNAFCHYLPMVLAFSASSPFWQKDDTGLASSRITFFEAIPTGGHPCLSANWHEFEVLIERLLRSQSITSIKDLWWDIRPNLEYGTIEIRIADCPPTIKETEALVALIHALAIYIDKELSAGRRFMPPPEWILRENKWRASRYGVECDLIVDPAGRTISLSQLWEDTRKILKPVSDSVGYEDQFAFLESVLRRGPSYSRQRKHYSGDLASVVQHLIRESKHDEPEWNDIESAAQELELRSVKL